MQEDEDKTGDANIQGKKDKFKNIPEEEEVEEAEEADEAREPFRSTAFRPGKTNKIHNFFLPNVTRRKHGELFYPFFISNNCHTRISAPASTFFSLIRRKEISLSPSSAVPFPNFPVKKYIVATMGGKREEGKERGVSSRSPHQPAVENGGVGLGGPWMDIFVCASYQKFIARYKEEIYTGIPLFSSNTLY